MRGRSLREPPQRTCFGRHRGRVSGVITSQIFSVTFRSFCQVNVKIFDIAKIALDQVAKQLKVERCCLVGSWFDFFGQRIDINISLLSQYRNKLTLRWAERRVLRSDLLVLLCFLWIRGKFTRTYVHRVSLISTMKSLFSTFPLTSEGGILNRLKSVNVNSMSWNRLLETLKLVRVDKQSLQKHQIDFRLKLI